MREDDLKRDLAQAAGHIRHALALYAQAPETTTIGETEEGLIEDIEKNLPELKRIPLEEGI